MTKIIEENKDQIIINKTLIEKISDKFLEATKAFFLTLIGQKRWDIMMLDKYWRFALPLIIILTLLAGRMLAYFLAMLTLVITGIWLWRQIKK